MASRNAGEWPEPATRPRSRAPWSAASATPRHEIAPAAHCAPGRVLGAWAISAPRPHRRRVDGRPPRPLPFGPTPGALGPPDRDGVLRSLENALAACRRHRRPLTLVWLDVAAPPGAGDAVLAGVAATVRATLRDTDGVWRDGAHSLVLLLADADGPSAEPALARLRLRLRRDGVTGVRMGRAAPAPGIDARTLLEIARGDCLPAGRR